MTKLRAALVALVAATTIAGSTLVATPSSGADPGGKGKPTASEQVAEKGEGAANKARNKGYAPPSGAVFNNPRGSRPEKFRIVNTVIQAIRHARPKSFIYITGFLFDSVSAADALIAARNRGVRVQIVFDGNVHNGPANRLGAALNKDNKKIGKGQKRRWPDGQLRKWGKDRSFVKWCVKSCRDGGDPNHAKWYVFTQTGKAKNVVMVSGSNLNKGGAQKGFNDMIILKERPKLVEKFGLVNDEFAEDSSKDGDGFLEFEEGNAVARFYPKKAAGDPVMEDLKAVRCNKAEGGAGRGGRTAVNVAMFRWNNSRGFALARKLVSMDKAGCIVKIVYGAPGKRVVDILKSSARNGGVELYDSRHFTEPTYPGEPREVYLRTHSKYLLINGAVKGDFSSWSVQTGSANWGQSLHAGDENTLTVYDRKIYQKYLENWRWVVNTASVRVR